VGLDEVLRPLDVHALAEHQAGADRVGADIALGPGGAADEAETVGHPSYAGRAGPPEHAAVHVGHDHQLARVDHRAEGLGQPRHELGEHAVGATPLQLAGLQGRHLGHGPGFEASGGDATPRRSDGPPRRGGWLGTGQHGLAPAMQLLLGVHGRSFPNTPWMQPLATLLRGGPRGVCSITSA
jgi:hypothetical protein